MTPSPHWPTRWSLRLALVGGLLLPLGALGARFEVWQFTTGFMLNLCGVVLSVIALLLALGSALRPVNRERRAGLLGIAALAAPALVVALLISSKGSVPVIHDITTDTDDPPLFQAAVTARGENSNPLLIDPEVIAQQLAAYPDIQPLASQLPPAAAKARALQIAGELGWDILDADSRSDHIEAVETTFWYGFKDDIVIRISASGDGSRLDLRSVSRVGKSDLGANANRIRRFSDRWGS